MFSNPRAHVLPPTLILILVAVSGALAAPVLLDAITAQVGEEIILESEVQEQLAVARMRFGLPDTALASAKEEILGTLIDQKIIVQEARKQGITVSDAEIDASVDELLGNLKQQMGSEVAFERALDEEGLTYEELEDRYRDQARNEILYSRLVQREIYSKIEITEEDVENYYREHRDELPPKQENVRLSHVFMGVRPSDDAISGAQGKLDQVRQRLDAGEEFGDIAAELSDDPGSKDNDGDIGWFDRGQLDPTFEQVAFSLEPGETSEPFQTAIGVELVRLIEKDVARDRVHAQHILVLLRADESDKKRARESAEKVHRLAGTGTSFGALAESYSDDRDSAEQGGDLGDFSVPDLAPFVAAAVADLGVGDISDVVETDQGFHVFKVTKRESGGEYTLAEISDELRNLIGEERAAAMTKEWLTDVRGNYYIRRAEAPIPADPGLGQPGVRLPEESSQPASGGARGITFGGGQ